MFCCPCQPVFVHFRAWFKTGLHFQLPQPLSAALPKSLMKQWLWQVKPHGPYCQSVTVSWRLLNHAHFRPFRPCSQISRTTCKTRWQRFGAQKVKRYHPSPPRHLRGVVTHPEIEVGEEARKMTSPVLRRIRRFRRLHRFRTQGAGFIRP